MILRENVSTSQHSAEVSKKASCLASSCHRQPAPSNLHRRRISRPSIWTKSRNVRCMATSEELNLFSPSKINLFLRIIRKREDGYHDLASLFHVIDVGDGMQFRKLDDSSQDVLNCNIAQVPTDDSNLVLRALKLFREKTGEKLKLKVNLKKRVPIGAGLGGGSANAATTLWAANEFCGKCASEKDLADWAGEIGSDISVFFSQGSAYCTGRGEIVEDLEPPLPLETPFLLVKPSFGCSTPQIFKNLKLENCSDQDPRELLSGFSADLTKLPKLCVNDLERPAFLALPELSELKARLQNESDGRFSAVFMTGSGSTIVCVGSVSPPDFLKENQYKDTFVRSARLIRRDPDAWYQQSPTLIGSR